MTRTARVVVDGRGARRARRGDPWVYADNVIESDAGPGSVLDLCSRAGEALALAAYSPRSTIALRRIAPAGERVDAVFWTHRRRDRDGAARGYRDLLRRALTRLGTWGRLLAFSYSFAVGDEDFERVAPEAAEESRRRLRILARPGPADDHPELLELPESRYLRGLQMEAREM